MMPSKHQSTARGARRLRERVGDDTLVLRSGSPARRAEDITAPVLLFHGDEDIDVDVKHSEVMASALERHDRDVEFIEYAEREHGILRNAERADMLRRIGAFLDAHVP